MSILTYDSFNGIVYRDNHYEMT